MKKLSLSLIAIISILLACSKKNEPAPTAEKVKQIKLVRYTTQNGYTFELKYKGDQLTEEIVTAKNAGTTSVSTFSYQPSGQLKEITSDNLGKSPNTKTVYIFSNGKLIRTNYINTATNELINYTIIEYLADQIVRKRFSKDDVLAQKDEYTLTADGKNYSSVKVSSGTTLLYTGYVLKMDDKNNPFSLMPVGYSTPLNTNNVLSIDFVFSNNANNQSQRNTLEYNEIGYPTKETDKDGKILRTFEYIIE